MKTVMVRMNIQYEMSDIQDNAQVLGISKWMQIEK